MSSLVLDTLASPWQTDASRLWTTSVGLGLGRAGTDGQGMAIVATGGAPGTTPPFARHTLTPAVDLSQYDEIRFWFRSTRPADGGRVGPFYLQFELNSTVSPLNPPFSRLIPIARAATWQMQQIWLGDMPAAARQSVSTVTLRSLDATVAFTATLSDIIATRPQPIQDTDQALFARLNNQFRVPANNGTALVPAVLDMPELQANTPAPGILITAWSIKPAFERAGAGDLIDNYTPQGAYVRAARRTLQLEYRLMPTTNTRVQKTLLFEDILGDVARHPWLVVDDEYIEIIPFYPSPQEASDLIVPGRTPLFYRFAVEIEAGVRVFAPQAIPMLVVGQPSAGIPESVVVPQ
jgi:hypothetical protein